MGRNGSGGKNGKRGKGEKAEITGEILTFLGEAGIDALFSILTGGASTAAKLGSKGGKILKYADDVGDLAKLDFDDVSDAQKSLKEIQQKRTMKVDLQFFAEKDLKDQSSTSLKRGIRKFYKRIDEHKYKINNPDKYDEKWSSRSIKEQAGLKKHWEKEISNFQESLNNRIEELKRGGDNYDV